MQLSGQSQQCERQFLPYFVSNGMYSKKTLGRGRINNCETGSLKACYPRVFCGMTHVKYIEAVKQILMLLYVLRSIHTNLLLDVLCYDVVRTNSKVLPKLNICLRPSCMWLRLIVLRLPKLFINSMPEGVCSGLLFVVLCSSLLMLSALYLRFLEENYSRRVSLWMKAFMVLPSVLVQLAFTALIINDVVEGVLHWRRFHVTIGMFLLAVAYAFMLLAFVLALLHVHLAAVVYVCRSSKRRQHQTIGYGTVGAPTTMLECKDDVGRTPLLSSPYATVIRPASCEISEFETNGIYGLVLPPYSGRIRKHSHSYTTTPRKSSTVDSPPYARSHPSIVPYPSHPVSFDTSMSQELHTSFRSSSARSGTDYLCQVPHDSGRRECFSLPHYGFLE